MWLLENMNFLEKRQWHSPFSDWIQNYNYLKNYNSLIYSAFWLSFCSKVLEFLEFDAMFQILI